MRSAARNFSAAGSRSALEPVASSARPFHEHRGQLIVRHVFERLHRLIEPAGARAVDGRADGRGVGHCRSAHAIEEEAHHLRRQHRRLVEGVDPGHERDRRRRPHRHDRAPGRRHGCGRAIHAERPDDLAHFSAVDRDDGARHVFSTRQERDRDARLCDAPLVGAGLRSAESAPACCRARARSHPSRPP